MLEEIKTRPFKAEDKAFVMSTWLKGQYYGHPYFSEMNKAAYNSQYGAYIEALLSKSEIKVVVACLREDPDVILGYAVLGPATLHWCYVKEPWRTKGIARLLTQPEPITAFTGFTKSGKAIAKRRGWSFNPWAV
jgi:hypothetical protein